MKAVFIDGPSIHNLGHAMGIARFNFDALHKFLSEDVGEEKELANKSVITVTPAMGKGTAKAYRAAGFEVIETISAHAADDLALIQRIEDLDPEKVHEVTLVSTDQDYIAALRKKAKQGLKVYWVGSMIKGPTGHPLMSTSLKPFLGTEFDFIDLLDHKDTVMGLPKKMPATCNPEIQVHTLKIELSGAKSRDEYATFVSAVTRLLRKAPHLKYTIQG